MTAVRNFFGGDGSRLFRVSPETYGAEETYRCRLGFRHLKSTRSTGEVALTENWPDSIPSRILGTVGVYVSFLN